MRLLSTSLAATLACAPALAAQPAVSAGDVSAGYVVARTIPLGPPDRWDYITFDPSTKRVLVSHSDHADVIDAATGRKLGELNNLQGAHGQAVALSGFIFADSGKTGQITAFDPASFKPLETLPAGPNADGVITDPKDGLIVVMNGDEGEAVTLIDSAARRTRATIPLAGSPEFAAADDNGHIYINIESRREIAILDAAAGRVTANIAVPDCESPHGAAIDTKTRRLFTTCENAVMVVINLDRHQVVQELPIGRGTDAAVFDPVHRQVFSSNGDGTLSVFDEAADGHVTPAATVHTPVGARTMAIDPATGRIFLVTADVDRSTPPTKTAHGLRYHWRPGSVKLLVLQPVGH